jgi:hypothetical protein
MAQSKENVADNTVTRHWATWSLIVWALDYPSPAVDVTDARVWRSLSHGTIARPTLPAIFLAPGEGLTGYQDA